MQTRPYFCVETLRVGYASAVISVGTFVDVPADLSVPAGVLESHALHARPPIAWRAGSAAEPWARVLARRSRIARLNFNTLKNTKCNMD